MQVERGGVLYDSLLIIRRNLHFVDIFFSFFFVAISNKGRKKGWFPAVFKTLIQVCQQQAKIKCIFSSHSMKKIYEIKEVQLMKIKYLDFYYSIARLLFFKGSLSTKLETLVGLCTNVTISKSRFLIIK